MKRVPLIAALALLPIATAAFAQDTPSEHKAAHAAPATERRLKSDTEIRTANGTQFLAPAGWRMREDATVLRILPPDGDGAIVVYAASGEDGASPDDAVRAAWKASGFVDAGAPRQVSDLPARDGWTRIRSYRYEGSPGEPTSITAMAYARGDAWTVFVSRLPMATLDRYRSEVAKISDRILPAGSVRESFEGMTAKPMGAREVAMLRDYIALAQDELGIPGVALGLVQDGRIVYAGGQGVRRFGGDEPVDADTRFLVASNTKAMTTMMLARLVDAGRLRWDEPVVDAWPQFRLGNDAITRQVQVKHLVCACTGLPRQDYEWLLEFDGLSADDVVARLGQLVPTTGFGKQYQYSNQLAAAGGYLGAHLWKPGEETGRAYDAAMQALVFDPLGMRDTTFDFDVALKGNVAQPHARDLQGEIAVVDMALNRSIIPMRPAGGVWSTVHDMLRFVQVELDKGVLPDGTRYVSEAALMARRDPQVALGAEASYGMGLMVDRHDGVTSVQHGGTMIGYQTGMMWLPDHDIGIVVLTNGDNGGVLMGMLRRRLLEVLFDGRPRAEAELRAASARLKAAEAIDRQDLSQPADAVLARALAGEYRNDALGTVSIEVRNGAVWADFGEWRSEVASRVHADGTRSLVTLAPGALGYELIVEGSPDAPTLRMQDAQHRYVFERVDAKRATAHR